MNNGNKRKDDQEDDKKAKRMKKVCDYGERCYRRNPAHFREFSHRHLESILDNYTGTGEYPIPDKYVLERLTIMEQLDVIVEKELYIPWHKADAPTINSSSSQNQISNSIRATSSNNTVTSSNNPATSSNNIAASCNNPATSSNNPAASSNNPAASSSNPATSSNNPATSSNNIAASSNNTAASKNIASNSMDAEMNSKPTDMRKKENTPKRMETFQNTDYKKAVDYRPIVPPTRRVTDFLNVVRPSGKMAEKHAATAPYHMFYTTITAAKETHNQPYSITFLEILDPSLGELKCSLQINFMVELGWLLAQYYFAGYSEKKLTILYGDENADLKTISQKKPHVDAYKVTMPTPFGTHHTCKVGPLTTICDVVEDGKQAIPMQKQSGSQGQLPEHTVSKMMLLCYEDGSLRVVISTANLYIDDWENRTQGLWFSPRCPELPAEAMPHDGESPTQFKRGLLRYLSHYHLPCLTQYIERVKRCDFSHINVFLVASVPGSHSDLEWGMCRTGALLRQHCTIPADENRKWSLIAQASSIGSYGPQPKLWLTGDFLHNFTKIKNQPQMLSMPPDLKLIYPSLENVRQSHDGLLGGGCLPYGAAVHTKQPWLNDFLYQWKAVSTNRDRAMPHIKSYTRISPDNKMAAFYLLTSANASKAAWGSVNKGNGNLRIMSYEAGVLFLPKFVINEDFFPLDERTSNRLVLSYDVPPTKYTNDMSPWVMDYLS